VVVKIKQEVSPMLEQYRRIKQKHTDDVLFFRLGDFYEMFAEDAVEISALLNLTLTSRNGLPMCGIPYHSARPYIARLLKAGKKVAICEQLTNPQKGKSIIERDVVEVITPGTTVDEDFLEKGDPNYIASLCLSGERFSFAYIELSTGDFRASSFAREEAGIRLREELERLSLKELVVQESLLEENSELPRALLERSSLLLNRRTDWLFDRERSLKRLKTQFGTESLKGFGLDDFDPEVIASGALLEYIDETSNSRLNHVTKISIDSESEYLGIDEASRRSLELVRNMVSGGEKFSLIELLDETKTAMGRRLLKQRLSHPLRSLEKIEKRLETVDYFYHNQTVLSSLREILGRSPDLERQCSRLAMSRSHGKDMLALKNALSQFERIENLIEGVYAGAEETQTAANAGTALCYESEEARHCDNQTRKKLFDLRDLLEKALSDDPSILLTEGKLIKSGYNAELDRLHTLRNNGRTLLEAYLSEERHATGISSLKIKYNRLIGYFFEVTNVHKSKVPAHFIKRQGVTGGERFTTERLVALESEINGAEDRIINLERDLFLELRDNAASLIRELNSAARRMAELDVAASLAAAATIHNWIKPRVDESKRLDIRAGRHPVVESLLARGEFIPNDTILDAGETVDSSGNATGPVHFALITGPNMAGKSTYLRQSALIVIMAQTGSFVPAGSAEIGIVDRIFCRVGAQDNLARGESTFLVEMNETAFILNTASDQSLVIMDEVGRGTGILDGFSIAHSVCDELLTRIKCRCLFATHYHGLVNIKNPRLANRSLEVEEKDGFIIFRRHLVEGPAVDSYGLQVARLAGLPTGVLARAAVYLKELQISLASFLEMDALQEALSLDAKNTGGKSRDLRIAPNNVFMNSSGNSEETAPHHTQTTNKDFAKILDEIALIQVNSITPIEAITIISKWREMLAGKKKAGSKEFFKPSEPDLFDV
jgi:DNA mismatch repair protein MutS